MSNGWSPGAEPGQWLREGHAGETRQFTHLIRCLNLRGKSLWWAGSGAQGVSPCVRRGGDKEAQPPWVTMSPVAAVARRPGKEAPLCASLSQLRLPKHSISARRLKQQTLFLRALDAGSPRSGCQQIWWQVTACCPLACRRPPLAVSSHGGRED